MTAALDFRDLSFYGNPLGTWIAALLIAVLTAAALGTLRRALTRRLAARAAQTASDVDNLLVDLLRRTRLSLVVVASVYAGALALDLPRTPARLLEAAAVVAALLQVAVWGNGLIAFAASRYVRHKMAEDAATATTVSAFGFIARLVLWTLIVFLALDNLGVNITALVAGLGIGGIAVALAVQNILGDLFASFSIVLDKPFVIGDFIVVGEYLGTVEHIGLKTTRIRSLSGEQIICSNSDLLNSRVRNYKRMTERRAVFTLGVTYETPLDKVAAIPSMIRETIESQPQTRFDRAHFKAYGDYALQFEAVYYVTSPDYAVYMDTQQAINFEIFRRFKEEGIDFAYPTQTLYVARP
jgi:small-conductance mechanosensitive channel